MRLRIVVILGITFLIKISSSCFAIENKKNNKNTINNDLDTVSLNKEGPDTTITTCNCPEPYYSNFTQIRIDYENRFLKFCSLDYIADIQKTQDFELYNDEDSLLMKGMAPKEFQVHSFQAPLRITELIEIPIKKGYQSVYQYKFLLEGNSFKIKKDFVYQAPIMEESKQDSLITVYDNQPKLKGKRNRDDPNPPLVSTSFVEQLFVCALNGNEKCQEAFEKLNTRFVIHGPSSSFYELLSELLESYKKESSR
jgi:hypothetical protein